MKTREVWEILKPNIVEMSENRSKKSSVIGFGKRLWILTPTLSLMVFARERIAGRNIVAFGLVVP